MVSYVFDDCTKQRDRKTRNVDDDQLRSRNGRRRDARGPPRGAYHPVNQDLLLGGGRNGDNDGYMSGPSSVSKKFVSPVDNSGANKRHVLCTVYVF